MCDVDFPKPMGEPGKQNHFGDIIFLLCWEILSSGYIEIFGTVNTTTICITLMFENKLDQCMWYKTKNIEI